ncbi:AraC family transcriptional regulator [Chryseobacterium sp. PBS4-4]|uniref:AraC family transcriptional regulator n=1 Tax=Chryseobacterium edaphi TaxID=2976532 RepID=A0ABT2W7U6_9FLAO|nr:AraC family transcriptional regulator [Chryseobacterium edaphi]MCU7617327.1 AraC family transcriptional regulator [Chryseobacterium edaphi]
MKKESTKGVIFTSDDIEIVMYDSADMRDFGKATFLEGKSSFNLLFLLSPDIHLNVNDCGRQFKFQKNQYILHYTSEESQAELWTNQETLKYLQIQIKYQYIFNLIDPESNRESEEILKQMVDNQFIFLYKKTPPEMTVEMHMILTEIVSYYRKGVMQKLFMEAKIIKLLILIFEQFNEKNTAEDLSKIPLIIKKFVDENFHRNLKIEEISKILGINETKIRKEFKIHYQKTIMDYISELRMLKAKKLIINKDLMIKEIAIDCGYEYVQNFTRAFKKKFGVSPEKLRTSSF